MDYENNDNINGYFIPVDPMSEDGEFTCSSCQ